MATSIASAAPRSPLAPQPAPQPNQTSQTSKEGQGKEGQGKEGQGKEGQANEGQDAAALAERIKALEAELAEARTRIAELEAELENQKRAQSATTNSATPNSSPSSPPPSPPPAPAAEGAGSKIASIEYFVERAKQEYAIAFPPPAEGDKPESSAAMQRSRERFVASMNREWKQQVRWNVFLRKAERTPDGTAVTVQLADDQGAPVGETFVMRADTRQNRRLETLLERATPNQIYGVTGLFVPRLSVNMERMTEGVFNNPPLVGPGVELRYEVLLDGIATAKTAKKPAPSTGNTAKP
jgi:hypothetical protein